MIAAKLTNSGIYSRRSNEKLFLPLPICFATVQDVDTFRSN